LIFTQDTWWKWEHRLYGWKYYSETLPMVYGIPSNSLGMRRYDFFQPTTQPKNLDWLNQSLHVGPESEDINTINIGYMCAFVV
jgi:hypothetical protein